MSNEKTRDPLCPSHEAMERQTEYDRAARMYTARCGVCGKTKTLKKGLFRSHSATIQKLRLQFNFCDTCGKWVCGDCFLIDNGNGGAMGICTACARERGITGLTGEQFEQAWPRIRSSLLARYRAAEKANAHEK